MKLFGTRWQRVQTYGVVGAWLNEAYFDDDKFTFEDIDETMYAAGVLGLIWSPQIAMAIPAFAVVATPLAIVEGAALAGLAVSFAIGGAEGAETYIDYIDPRNYPELISEPGKQEALIQASDITLSIINPLYIPQKMLAEWIVEDLPWGEVFKNRWLGRPVLPF